MADYLVVVHLTADNPTLRDKVAEIVADDPGAEFVIVVPTLLTSWTLHLLGRLEDRPLPLGWRRAERCRRCLEAVGARVLSTRLSLHDPLVAAEIELQSGEYRGVIVSTLPRQLSHWLHQDVPGKLARAYPGINVMTATAPADFYGEQLGLQPELEAQPGGAKIAPEEART
jgi:GABA permease